MIHQHPNLHLSKPNHPFLPNRSLGWVASLMQHIRWVLCLCPHPYYDLRFGAGV